MHVERTRRLTAGERLTTITADIRTALGIDATVLPMCDTAVGTIVHTADGPLPFQEYFVRLRCEVPVTGFAFDGIERATVSAEVTAALTAPSLDAIVICPSNPFVSIDPILAVPGLRQLVAAAGVPVIAVSPIIRGKAVKGPAAKMLGELGKEISAVGVARHYGSLLSGFMIDREDAARAAEVETMGIATDVADTLMADATGRRRVAQACLNFIARLRRPA